MLRKELLDTLDLIKPALAEDPIVPIFTNYCFDNKIVFATKGSLTIMAPCEIGAEFSVNGKTLSELLKNSISKEVDFSLTNDEVVIKSAKSKMKLPFFTKAEYLFEEPEDENWEIMFEINADFLHALELCVITTIDYDPMPALKGVIMQGGKPITLYSSDSDAVSSYKLGVESDSTKQYTIPADFCNSLLRIVEKTNSGIGYLYVNENWIVAEMINDYRLISRTIENPNPIDFSVQIQNAIKKTPSWVGVPKGLEKALVRAQIIGASENRATELTVKKGKLNLVTETHLGSAKDFFKVEHDEVEASVNAKLMHRALTMTDEFSIMENITLYRTADEKYQQVLSNYEG